MDGGERCQPLENDRFWPEAAPHGTSVERLLLVKADTQNHEFGKLVDERLRPPPESSLSDDIVWAAAADPMVLPTFGGHLS